MDKAAADYMCACGHLLHSHDRPTGTHQPWGRCFGLVQIEGEHGMRRCPCQEAWPLEDDE